MYPTESVSVYRRIYATLSDFMGSIQMCTAWEWVTLLLLLCPSCLSFAKTNKIKLNCLKIAKNETKCRKGRHRQTVMKRPNWRCGRGMAFPCPLAHFGWENTQLIRENSTQAPRPRSRIKVFLARNWILSGGCNGDKRAAKSVWADALNICLIFFYKIKYV